MTGSEEDGKFRLEDRRVRGKGVGPDIVLSNALVDDLASAQVVTRFGAISIDGQLTRLAESRLTRKAVSNYSEVRQRIHCTEVVVVRRHGGTVKESRPVRAMGSIVAFGGGVARPGHVNNVGVAEGRMHRSASVSYTHLTLPTNREV